MKLSDYLARRLVDLGVRHVFTVAGGGAMHLVDSFGHCDGLTLVPMQSEHGAAVAAETYAKLNGLGVCLVTSGPGSTNAITGCTAAFIDSSPVLFLSGQVRAQHLKKYHSVGYRLRQYGSQEVDIVSMVQHVTKSAHTLGTEHESIRYRFERTIYGMTSGRPGPGWLDIPLDVQAWDIDPEQPGFTFPKTCPSPPNVGEVLGLLGQAKRPVLLLGNGCRASRFRDLVDLTGIPTLVATSMGIDLIEDQHPMFFGRPGPIAPRYANFILQNCDLLLSIGARLDMSMCGHRPENLAPRAQHVVVDIDRAELEKLPQERRTKIQADAGEFVDELLKFALACEPPTCWVWRTRFLPWFEQCKEWRAKYPLDRSTGTYAFATALSDATPEDAVVVTGSSGSAVEITHLCWQAKRGQRVLHSRGLGSMGFGIPAAIGAALATGKSVTCIEGDGSFCMEARELETVRRLGLPITFYVVNNGGYASIRESQGHHFGRETGADISSGMTLPRIKALAECYGLGYAESFNHERRADVDPLKIVELSRCHANVCNVFVPILENRFPRLVSRINPDGTMQSPDLMDLWPHLPAEELPKVA